MVAQPGLLEPLEVGVEILLRVERRAVDARELRVLRVAAPVCAGQRRELDGLDRIGALQVRTAAEVDEISLLVQRNRAFGIVDELDLVGLAVCLEAHAGRIPIDRRALPGAALLDLAVDLILEALEVLVRDRLGEVEVVVEAVVDRRADRDLGTRIEPLHGLGQQVGGRVPQYVERVGIVAVARGQDLNAGAVLERVAQVECLAALEPDEHGLLRQARADSARRVKPGRAVLKLELGVVRKDDLHRPRQYRRQGRPPPGL